MFSLLLLNSEIRCNKNGSLITKIDDIDISVVPYLFQIFFEWKESSRYFTIENGLNAATRETIEKKKIKRNLTTELFPIRVPKHC